MRTAFLIVTAAAISLALAPGSVGARVDAAQPAVRITSLSPLVVAGERFRPTERVVIKVTADGTRVMRYTRVSRRGTFVARFSAVTADRCNGGVSVVVTTADGRVAKTRMPQLLCPPGVP